MKTVARQIASMVLVACVWVAGPEALHAQEHISLEKGFPLQVEDAYPSPYRDWEFEMSSLYDRTRDERNLFVLAPEIAYGIARNADVAVEVPVSLGSADKTSSGDIELEAFYNFNGEGLVFPAFALKGTAVFPTGRDSHGVGSQILLIATKSISNRLDRLRFNVEFENNADPLPDERDNRWTFIMGYSGRLGPDMMVVADVVRRQGREEDEASNVVELGLRRMLTPLAVLSTAVGAGFGDESPPFRFVLALQAVLTPALLF